MGAGGVGPAFQRLGHRRLRLGQDGRGGGVIQIETVGSHGRETLIDCGNGGGFYIGGLSRSASICCCALSIRGPPCFGWGRPEPYQVPCPTLFSPVPQVASKAP